MADKLDFSALEDSGSKFKAFIPDEGGYINFTNSGRGGDSKSFTLGLQSWISSLVDLRNAPARTRPPTDYSESEWRIFCGNHFKDLPANAMSTVQTKPMFVVLSKIIMLANGLSLSELDPQTKIDLSDQALDKAIDYLKKISRKYLKRDDSSKASSGDVPEIFTSVRDFARYLFSRFYGKNLDLLISGCIPSQGARGRFSYLDYDVFKGLFAEFDAPQGRDGLSTGSDRVFLRFFEEPFHIANGKYYYFSNQWNGNGEYSLSYENLKSHFESRFEGIKVNRDDERYWISAGSLISVFISKPFVLFPGISGTGKSRFVRKQVSPECYLIVPVRPDWHEPSDLLGYVSRIGGKPEYVATETLRFMAEAWKNAYFCNSAEGVVLKPVSEMLTYWLCLDEMNLAPVEQYFADYLSVLESREWDGEVGSYKCDPIFKIPDGVENIRAALGLGDSQFDDLWSCFSAHGMPLPPNLIVAGTVNMDETTHGFSRKVIDRALTFDFGEFFPNDFNDYFGQSAKPVKFVFPTRTHIHDKSLLADAAADADGSRSIAFLNEINGVLKGTPFELAYRALNELLLSVYFHSPGDDESLKAVWDDFIMMKVLPRIEGDADKLASRAVADKNIIELLEQLLAPEFPDGGERIDFYRNDKSGQRPRIPFRSIRKLRWMQQRLQNNGFTSFWP